MKNLIFLLSSIILTSFTSKGQTTVIAVGNSTSCDILVRAFCYDPITCYFTGAGYTPFTVKPMTSHPVSLVPCSPTEVIAFQISWAPSGPPNCNDTYGTTFVEGTYPASGCYSLNPNGTINMPPCPMCNATGTANVAYDPGSNTLNVWP